MENYRLEIFVSYAWGGESEIIVNDIDKTLFSKNIEIIRDKRDFGFKGMITDFMNKIGKGKAIIVVISDKYLKSPYCMYELLEIYRNLKFQERIFPIVISDAKIFEPIPRLQYLKYWQDKKNELDEAIKSFGTDAITVIGDDYKTYKKIFDNFGEIVNVLKDINSLTPQMHKDENYHSIIIQLQKILDTDKQDNVKTVKVDITNLKNIATNKIEQSLNEGFFLQKYKSDLYQNRKEVETKFQDFITQNERISFIVTGKAGRGKTNLICNLISTLLQPTKTQYIPVLLNGTIFEISKQKSIEQYLVSYFEIDFDNIISSLKSNNKTLVYFIDAINEIETELKNKEDKSFRIFNEQMDCFIKNVLDNKLPILFCISCRTDSWHLFYENMWVADSIFEKDNAFVSYSTTFELDRFSEFEFDEVKPKYFSHYLLEGELIGETRELCKDPIMLLYFCEAHTKREENRIIEVSTQLTSLRKKKIFDDFVYNIRPKLKSKVEKVTGIKLDELEFNEYTANYILRISEKMYLKKRKSISLEEIHEIALKINNHPDAKLKTSELDKPGSVFFTLTDEGILLTHIGRKEFEFVFETYFEYSLGRFFALIEWKNCASIIQSLDDLLKEHIENTKTINSETNLSFTNILPALEYSILIVEEDNFFENTLFIQLISKLFERNQHQIRQLGFSTIRETKFVANLNQETELETINKINAFFTSIKKLTNAVDFAIMWDLQETILKLFELNKDYTLVQIKNWANAEISEKNNEIQALYAIQILLRIYNDFAENRDEVLNMLTELSQNNVYKTNFWLARTFILGSLNICKNPKSKFKDVKKLREFVENYYITSNSNFIRGIALSSLPFMSYADESFLDKIKSYIKSENYVWGLWNLAYELKNWLNYNKTGNIEQIIEILDELLQKDNQHINYAIANTLIELQKKSNNPLIRQLLDNENLEYNIWRSDRPFRSIEIKNGNSIGIVYSPVFLEPSIDNHVECRERLQSILNKILSFNLECFEWIDPVAIDINNEYLKKVHNSENDRHSQKGNWKNYPIDVKTAYENYINNRTNYAHTNPSELRFEDFPYALYSVGAVIQAINYVTHPKCKSRIAWSFGRPPGHLANNKICIFNNVAIGARYAIDKKKFKKILIIDIDAHHGQHTNRVFRTDSNIIYFSAHIDYGYSRDEGNLENTGEKNGEGYNFNILYPEKMSDEGYIYIINKLLIPVIEEFEPELILLSAGFDGHFEDPLTPQCQLTERAYINLAEKLKYIYDKNTNIKIVGAIEGGYGLNSLANSFMHMINIIGNLGIDKNEIGFVKGNPIIAETAFNEIKSNVSKRVRLMKEMKNRNPNYLLYQDENYWETLIID